MATPDRRAVRLVQVWAWLYTRGLPDAVKRDRVAEIESDLWEQSHELRARGPGGISTTLQILLRLVFGIPFDIAWRLEVSAAIRSGKEPEVRFQPWTANRWFALIGAIVLLPIPLSWLRSAGRNLVAVREESNFSIALLAVGSNVAVIPIGFGFLAMFWEAPSFPANEVGVGLGQVMAGLGAFAGLYLSRSELKAGFLLIGLSTIALAFLASWALAGVIVGSAVLGALAVGRAVSDRALLSRQTAA
jgi:hypothetical protein